MHPSSDAVCALLTHSSWTLHACRPSFFYHPPTVNLALLTCHSWSKVKNSVNIPVVNMTKVYDKEKRTFSFTKEPNPDFVAQVRCGCACWLTRSVSMSCATRPAKRQAFPAAAAAAAARQRLLLLAGTAPLALQHPPYQGALQQVKPAAAPQLLYPTM